ncbi:hypothetical protein GCM10010168_71680 [Actinoplanes ianthinogenes]|uniref:Uncharacterized protein n=1 Tax=Actinoplanes ianthinogenes TaxID=122358 RepID=A0ABN6CPV6_9ACTN|nr:hypothetical protein [Actinoplanes ianthinogenes]BCJ47243.1 hypothetical protein Aiant_79000 [Actinoplanes ianthinogenes]GGR42514.1 hypothetical protein GCM10010168_71680 [Actinoplanes ianthinogenes]
MQIPALAITDGTAAPEWVEVPLSRWRFKRRPSQRLPLDPHTAKSVRRYLRLAPWSLLVGLVSLAAWWGLVFADLPSVSRAAAVAVACGGSLWPLAERRGLPEHMPSRTRSGDLHIPQVPVEVADQWVVQNPGVIATEEPAPRPHSRRFYASWATGLLAASIALAAVLANDGREDSILLWILLPALFFTSLTMVCKMQPPAKDGTVRTWPPGAA